MGKTRICTREERRLRAALKNSADESLLQDLAGSETGDEVRRRLFGNDKIHEWKTGTHRLTLFVDSVGKQVEASKTWLRI